MLERAILAAAAPAVVVGVACLPRVITWAAAVGVWFLQHLPLMGVLHG